MIRRNSGFRGGFNYDKSLELARVVQGGVLDFNYQTGRDLASMIADAVSETGAGCAKQLQMLGEVFARGLVPSERAEVHRRVAERAQLATLRSYDQTVTRQKKAAGRTPYRTNARAAINRRYAGGALRRALASPDFVDSDANGIRFGNTTRLDREARHWARLNAGAGGRGSGSNRTFQLRFNNLVVGSIGIDMAARPAFMLPKGYWWKMGEGPVGPNQGALGQHQFFPMGEGPRGGRLERRFVRGGEGQRIALQRRRLSQGIRARNFLDAGAGAIANGLGPGYDRLLGDIWKRGTEGPRAQLRVQVRPRRGQFNVRTFRGSYG